MHEFRYIKGRLFCEDVSVESLVQQYGTPLYVYSQKTITNHFKRLQNAMASLPHLICFSVKSNSNAAVLRTLANMGGGFDVVSEGELRRVVSAGGNPKECVFAGVGKTEAEIDYALSQNIYAFTAESEPEIQRINRLAANRNQTASIAVRVNPNVDALTHPKITTGTYINKFGIPLEEIEAVYARAKKLKNVKLRGIQMHIGSQLTEVKPFEVAVKKLTPIIQSLVSKYQIEFFSLGGGIGIVYNPAVESGLEEWWQTPEGRKILTPESYAQTLVPLLKPLGVKIVLEPGRFIIGNAGIMVTRVEYIKKTGKKNFAIVDAAMNDLVRPAFYDSYHQICPLIKRSGSEIPTDVVGPICESSDCFCKDRPLPKVSEGDCLVLFSAGAYGFSMASNYNSRPLPAEILVNGKLSMVVRPRQFLPRIWDTEKLPRWLKSKGRKTK